MIINKIIFNIEIILDISIGILTYLGSTFLGIIVFYNSWLQQYKEEKLDYSLNHVVVFEKGIANFLTEKEIPATDIVHSYILEYNEVMSDLKYFYICIKIKNYNTKFPMECSLKKIEVKTIKKEIVDCTDNCRIECNFDMRELIDYKTENKMYIGINIDAYKKLVSNEEDYFENKLCFYLKLSNSAGQKKCICFEIKGSVITEKELSISKFKKIVNKGVLLNEIIYKSK